MVSPGLLMRGRVAGSLCGQGVRSNGILSGAFHLFIIVYVNLLRPETNPTCGQATAHHLGAQERRGAGYIQS